MTGKCDVYGKSTEVKAACSGYGPVTYAYCQECLNKGLEPYSGVVTYIACGGHFPKNINAMYKADVRRMLPLWGKTEKEFIADVDKEISDMDEYFRMLSKSADQTNELEDDWG